MILPYIYGMHRRYQVYFDTRVWSLWNDACEPWPYCYAHSLQSSPLRTWADNAHKCTDDHMSWHYAWTSVSLATLGTDCSVTLLRFTHVLFCNGSTNPASCLACLHKIFDLTQDLGCSIDQYAPRAPYFISRVLPPAANSSTVTYCITMNVKP